MGGNFSIGAVFKGPLQQAQGFFFVAQPELSPSQAVGDVRVGRCKFQGFGDELLGLCQPHVAVCKRVAQGVVGMVVIGFDGNHLPQQPLHHTNIPHFFSEHGLFIKPLHVVGRLFKGLVEQLVSLRVFAVIAQQLQFSSKFEAGICLGACGQALEQLAGFVQLALFGQRAGASALHSHQIFWAANLGQPSLRACKVFALLCNLSQG